MTRRRTYTDQDLWAIATQVLTPRQTEVCRLIWIRNLTIRQTADLLELAPGTVTDHLRAARRRLATATRKAAA